MHDMLRHGFANDVNGLHAVVRISTGKSFTYEINGGLATFIGEGDLHDPNALYHDGAHINPQYFADTAPAYTLDLYSTEAFVEEYSTENPWIACIGAVAIIVFTSLLFFSYDFFVRKEFSSKKSLLESKRQFVRFVSHEVRTPLNTVCMGLTLMQDDFSKCLGLRHGVAPSSNSGDAERRKSASCTTGDNATNPSPSGSSHIYESEQVEDWMQLSAQIQSNAEAAVSVLNDLLNYDKIQMGNLTLELSLMPAWSIIQKTVAEFQIASLEKHIRLKCDFTSLLEDGVEQPDVPQPDDDHLQKSILKQLTPEKRNFKIVADNIRIAQVLRNLISNGLKFSSENGTYFTTSSHPYLPYTIVPELFPHVVIVSL